jgi:hypothetical protein
MADYTDAIKILRERRQAIANEMGKIDEAVRALGGIRSGTTTRRKPKFAKAGLARIAAAQRKRWARIKAGKKWVVG